MVKCSNHLKVLSASRYDTHRLATFLSWLGPPVDMSYWKGKVIKTNHMKGCTNGQCNVITLQETELTCVWAQQTCFLLLQKRQNVWQHMYSFLFCTCTIAIFFLWVQYCSHGYYYHWMFWVFAVWYWSVVGAGSK